MSERIQKLHVTFRRLLNGESGQDVVEYGMLVTLIALVCISGLQGAANSVNGMFSEVSQALVSQNQQPAQQQQPSPAPTPHHDHHHGGGGGWGWWH